ncbi:PAS domain-containing sensor histidine kinase [Caulobacter mirabilis]|uniref:histidine kinase n=1 Tax=Caulobacter mirabilis TaxID=69666 RepID=A0A2D2B0T9_9CAUL|nr:ATP-binding protein [Caulobacter mirabilis]ATQ43873.1 PAS domain-containing sensor histidine kinase [Caulobacter mirabilis]
MPQGGFGDLFELAHESILVRDMDGRLLSWNAASTQLYGWSEQDALGRSLDALFGDGANEIAPELLANGRWDGEIRRRNAAGADLVVEIRQSLRRGPDGQPVGIVEIGRDITAKLDAERALKAAERRYTNLFQAMAASFWELDFTPVGTMLRRLRKSGVDDYSQYFRDHPAFIREMMRVTRIVDVNDATVRLFAGGDRSLLTGSVEPYWPEAAGEVYAASVVAAVSGAPSYSTETTLRRADGSEFQALFTAAFPSESVDQGALLIGVIDISERKRAQAAERRLQDEFAHSARISMLGELTASIAHEVNQPLAAIATNGSASLRWLSRSPPDTDRCAVLTERIVADAQRAADIIGRIRGMASNQPTAVEALSINALVRETAIFLQPELAAHDVMLTVATAAGLEPVRGDRTQLQQVFANLLINGAQAMSQARCAERRLVVRTGMNLAGHVQVTVEDTGPGLAPEHLERLFESFFTTKASGMGMGLAICRSIVERHGGGVTAGNGPQGGAVFTIVLPVDEAA